MLKAVRTVIFSLVVAISSAAIYGQVPVQISAQKIVSAGKVYYMHEVQKDQTLYSISRAYKVSIDAITSVNEIPSYGIVPGQILKIPASEPKKSITTDEQAKEMALKRGHPQPPSSAVASAKAESQPPSSAVASAKAEPQPQSQPKYEVSTQKIISDGKVYYMHQVEKGQTLYSIARTYKVTIDDINRENVIASYGIAPGQVLKIPSTETPLKETVPANPQPQPQPQPQPPSSAVASAKAEPQPEPPSSAVASAKAVPQPEPQIEPQPPSSTVASAKAEPQPQPATAEKKPAQPEKKTHKVQKGESLSEIADKYGITVSELKQANKGLIFPTAGMRLVIPAKKEEGGDSQD